MKNRSRPPMVASTFLRTASAVPRFLSRFERGGRGERVRGTKRDSRKSSGGAIKSSGRDRCSRSASRRTFIDRTMTHSSFRLDDSSTFLSRNSFRFGEGISHCILSVEFVIYFSFFFLSFFFFTRCLGRRKCELLFLLLFIWTEESVRGIIPSWAQKTNLIIPVDPANSISGNLK